MRLAVYGTLKPGGSRWHLIENEMEVLYDDFLAYGSLHNVNDQYPAATFEEAGTFTGVILGSLPHVDEVELFEKLDKIEGHPHLFYRQLVELPTLQVDDDEWEDYVTCWMYVARAPQLLRFPKIKAWPPNGDEV